MAEPVNPVSGDRRGRQVARTEARILDAAARLFLERGYADTTIEDIAALADVAARTVYVRFATKAELFKRVVDVAIVGDTEAVPVLGREGMQRALGADTLAERIAAMAAVGREIMERTGRLFGVAQQAAAVEPLVAGYWKEGRAGVRHNQDAFWRQMAEDGLLGPRCDLDWLVDTAAVVTAAETYLLISSMFDWDLDAYEAWLARTLTALAEDCALGESRRVGAGTPSQTLRRR